MIFFSCIFVDYQQDYKKKYLVTGDWSQTKQALTTTLPSTCRPWSCLVWVYPVCACGLPKYYNRISPQYWDSLSTYHICPKIWNSSFYYLLMCQNDCSMYGKQCRPWLDAVFCGIWSESTLFVKAYLFQILRVITVIKGYIVASCVFFFVLWLIAYDILLIRTFLPTASITFNLLDLSSRQDF